MMTAVPIGRRTLLGAALAGVIAPGLANAQQGYDPASQEPTEMRVRFTFADETMMAILYDNPSARDFFAMLPLELTLDDFAHNEKIAYLPRPLTEDGAGPFDNARPGDLCYFAPWGNLALFYADYSWSRRLIRLGRFEDGHAPLLIRGEFGLRVEAV